MLRLIGGDEVVKDAAVELLDGVEARIKGQLSIEDAGLDAKFLEEELDAVGSVGVVDKDEALAADELELEDDVEQQELVDLGAAGRGQRGCGRAPGEAPDRVLSQVGELVLLVLDLQDRLHARSVGSDPDNARRTGFRNTTP